VEKTATVEAGDCLKIGPCWFVCQIDGTPKEVKKAYEKFAQAEGVTREDTATEMEVADSMAETHEPDNSEPDSAVDEFEELFDEKA
jgi:hypothetical protein